jgi:hypothetical protein
VKTERQRKLIWVTFFETSLDLYETNITKHIQALANLVEALRQVPDEHKEGALLGYEYVREVGKHPAINLTVTYPCWEVVEDENQGQRS